MAGLVPAIYVLQDRSARKGVDGRDKPGHDDLFLSCRFSEFTYVIRRLPARPDRRPRYARDFGREARHCCRGNPLRGAHRRDARGDGQRDRSRRRLHQIEVPVRARGIVPCQTERRQIFQGRIGPRAGGEFRQRQCLHRQDRATGDHADGIDCRQGGRVQLGRGVSRLHRSDRRTVGRHQIQRRARHAGRASRAG